MSENIYIKAKVDMPIIHTDRHGNKTKHTVPKGTIFRLLSEFDSEDQDTGKKVVQRKFKAIFGDTVGDGLALDNLGLCDFHDNFRDIFKLFDTLTEAEESTIRVLYHG